MSDIKTETHEYTENKSDDWSGDPIFLFLIIILCFGWGNTTDISLEKEVAELKGKVDVIERLVAK